jgi:hypothetical protein
MIVPEDNWPVDYRFEDAYDRAVALGRAIAEQSTVSIVGIARNCMPHLENTLKLVESVIPSCGDAKVFFFENDSTDGTDKNLDFFSKWTRTTHWRISSKATVKHASLCRPHLPGQFEGPRTQALAEYRQECLDWVRENAAYSDYTVVLDMDPHGGFSVDGVFNSICQLERHPDAACMASYSLGIVNRGERSHLQHYDAWAARPTTHWHDRREEIGFHWFFYDLPPVGSQPIRMNSAFGGLAVYKTSSFLAGGYSGEDCEHVTHHRRIALAAGNHPRNVYLNPGCRYVATITQAS